MMIVGRIKIDETITTEMINIMSINERRIDMMSIEGIVTLAK